MRGAQYCWGNIIVPSSDVPVHPSSNRVKIEIHGHPRKDTSLLNPKTS